LKKCGGRRKWVSEVRERERVRWKMRKMKKV
jgi:hypothetical protein